MYCKFKQHPDDEFRINYNMFESVSVQTLMLEKVCCVSCNKHKLQLCKTNQVWIKRGQQIVQDITVL